MAAALFTLLALLALVGLAFSIYSARASLAREKIDREVSSELERRQEATGLLFSAGAAIRNPNDDRLERNRFANALADALAQYESDDSLVVGLLGPWGTGKSSLLNLLDNALQTKTPQPVIVRFNPWYFPSEDQLYAQFFRAMLASLNQPDLAARYHSASELIANLSKVVESFQVVPVFGSIASVAAKGMDIASSQFGKRAEQLRDLEQLKGLISTALRTNKRRIIVLVDDIDRLTPAEIRLMFKLVKGVADFQYVIYVVAFDREHVANALSEASDDDEERGYGYLDKIVNVPIDIPAITRPQIFELLAARLEQFVKDRVGRELKEDDQMLQLLYKLSPLFQTLRHLDRFANLLVFGDSLVHAEVDYPDFIALMALQSLVPKLYTFVRNNKTLFIDTPETIILRSEAKDKQADKIALETEIGRYENAEAITELLTYVFPRVDAILNNRSHSDEERRQWSKQFRVASSSERFDLYFQLAMPSNDVAKSRVDGVLNNLDYMDFNRSLLSLKTENLAIPFMESLKDFTDDPRVIGHAEDVVHVLLDASDGFEDDLRGFPARLDGHILIMQLVFQILKRQDEDARVQILRHYFARPPEAIAGVVTQISVEDQSHGRYDLGGRTNPSGQLLSDNNLDEIESLAADLIEEWARDGRLTRNSRLTYILFRWVNWRSKEVVQSYVITVLPDREFVKAMVSLASEGLVFPNNALRTDAKLIRSLAEPELVRQRLIAIKGDETVDAEIKELVSRFDLDSPHPQ